MARLDKYLAKLNGKEGDIPAPVSTLDKEMQTLAESGGSGGGVLVATFTATPNDDDGIDVTCDKTYTEIMTAIGNGTTVFSMLDSEGVSMPSYMLEDAAHNLHTAGYILFPDDPPFLMAVVIKITPTNEISGKGGYMLAFSEA